MTGFRVAKLIVSGDGKPEASISFEAGFNVLTGPSNSGKSYIVECIDFVLGSDTIPSKDIEEGKGYDSAFLEIETYDRKPFTLERGLVGGDIRLYESRYADRSTAATRTLAAESQTKKNETLSTFLLKQMNIENVKVRTNANGELGNLTFRTISHLFIVDETGIIAKKHSPIRLATGFAKTASERAFNYILTGQDDHAVVAAPNPKERKALLQGRKDLYDELIAGLEKHVAGIDIVSIRAQIQQSEDAITKATQDLTAKTGTIHEHQLARQTAFDQQHASESRLIAIAEILIRFNLLKQHYGSDLQRLDFISEGEHYFDQLVAVNCPLCGAPLDDHASHKLSQEQPEALGSVQAACRAEAQKIRTHLADLEQTIQTLIDERTGTEGTAHSSREEIGRLDKLLTDELKPTFESGKAKLDGFIQRRHELAEIDSAFAALHNYRNARLALDQRQPKEKNVYAGLDLTAARGVCDVIQDMLRAWNFIDNKGVVEFDENSMDIRIAGKHRQSNGKGLRGFLHGAFNLGLMRYCKAHGRPHAGFILLDSPITSYREGRTEEAEDEAAPQVQSAFWNHLADTPSDEQVIIVENKEPTEKARVEAHYIHFYGPKSFEGRRGFFPTLAE